MPRRRDSPARPPALGSCVWAALPALRRGARRGDRRAIYRRAAGGRDRHVQAARAAGGHPPDRAPLRALRAVEGGRLRQAAEVRGAVARGRYRRRAQRRARARAGRARGTRGPGSDCPAPPMSPWPRAAPARAVEVALRYAATRNEDGGVPSGTPPIRPLEEELRARAERLLADRGRLVLAGRGSLAALADRGRGGRLVLGERGALAGLADRGRRGRLVLAERGSPGAVADRGGGGRLVGAGRPGRGRLLDHDDVLGLELDVGAVAERVDAGGRRRAERERQHGRDQGARGR